MLNLWSLEELLIKNIEIRDDGNLVKDNSKYISDFIGL